METYHFKRSFLLKVMLVLFFTSSNVFGQYSGGSGEPNDPYQIATAADLILLGETPGDYDKHFIMTADIDLDPNLLGGQVFERAVIAPNNDDEEWFDGIPFNGVFDGNGHTISHMTIQGSGMLGLFGQTGFGARISNLGLEAVDVNGTHENVGGLVGGNEGSITSCYSTGAVSGNEYVGGLVGSNGGFITSCYSTGSVSGVGEFYAGVGGLVGTNGGNILASYSTCSVTGNDSVGGLVGYNSGYNNGSISNCYSTGPVSGNFGVGGLVGSNGFIGLGFPGSIAMCYSTSKVTGGGWGLVGQHAGDFDSGFIFSSFWSGQFTFNSDTGLTSAQMLDINTYLNEGWDFINENANGTCDYWQISPGEYPRLCYQNSMNRQMPEGLGTAEHPYLIRDVNDLGTVWLKPQAHYRVETPLNLSGSTWSMAVVPWFGGTFDGNGQKISNLHIEGAGFLGLFGQLSSTANISNLGLEAVDVNGTHDNVGGLVGFGRGSITNCYSNGIVAARKSVGGLMGENEGCITASYSTGSVDDLVSGGKWWDGVGGLVGSNGGSITASYSTNSVAGDESVGGLVGFNSGDIVASYSTNSVTGNYSVGGLVGINHRGNITKCYRAGAISGNEGVGGLVGHSHFNTDSITLCFWDTEISGLSTSVGGTGKTTAEMRTANTFLEAGWDFIDETENGINDVWKIIEGQTYPLLSWQKYGGGAGEPNNPYLIYTAGHLNELGVEPNDYEKHFKLMADIDLSGYLYDRAVIAPDVNDVGWRFDGIPFNGVFDGNKHVISNLTITEGSYLGLFGQSNSDAMIAHLGLEAAEISGRTRVATLTGRNYGRIISCYSTGLVVGGDRVGGLVGVNGPSGLIVTSYSKTNVTGGGDTGGFVGRNYGSVKSSYSTGWIEGENLVGGFVGSARENSIVISSFWDIETSGQTTSPDGTGKPTAEMQVTSTFLGAGWDFIGETANGKEDIWWIDEGKDYPTLWWEIP